MENNFFIPVIGLAGLGDDVIKKDSGFLKVFLEKMREININVKFYSTIMPSKDIISKELNIDKKYMRDPKRLKCTVGKEKLEKSSMYKKLPNNATLHGILVRRYERYSNHDILKIIEKNRNFDGVLIFYDVRLDSEANMISKCGGIVVHVDRVMNPRILYKTNSKISRVSSDLSFRCASERSFNKIYSEKLLPYITKGIQSLYIARELKLIS